MIKTRPGVPPSHASESEHRRQLANGINLINQTTPDYSRTDAEIAAGITPVDLHYPPGDIRRYGAQGGGADDRAAIQAAIDGSAGANEVYIPPGEWIVGAALQWRTGSHIRGAGMGVTIIKLADNADEDSNVLEPIDKDGSVVNWSISDLTLDGNASRPTVSGVGTDRPGASCLATMGASYGVLRNIEAKNAVLHCIDICNGGEIEGGQRYYVSPSHAADPTYYPDNLSRFVWVNQCIGDNAGDDAITAHYCRWVWIDRSIGRNASHRHPTPDACNGIELDDGCRDVWVTNCLAHNVVRGFAAKTHPPQPSPLRVHFLDCVAEQCNTGFYIHKSGTSTIGGDVFVVNPVVRDPKLEVAQSDAPLHGIHVQNAPSCYIINPLIHAPYDTELDLDQAILISTGAVLTDISGGNIENWPNAASGGFTSAIHATSTVDEVRIHGTRIKNSGWRGITSARSSGGVLRIRDVDIIGENVPNSIGILTAGELSDIDLEVSGITITGFVIGTQYGSVTSTEGLEVKRNEMLLSGLPEFDSDAEAATLAPGQLYRTSTGEVRIKL